MVREGFLPSAGLARRDSPRLISLAGAQEKIALRFDRRRWCRPRGATPTTHILKLPLGPIGHMQVDLRAFLKAQVVFWFLAAPDGHAKNFSLFHERGGRYRLTPFFDGLSAWPIVGPGAGKIPRQKLKMAMAVEGKNRHDRWEGIHARHWIETGRRCGLADLAAILADVVARTPAARDRVEAVIPKGFPARISDPLLAGVRASAERLRTELT